MTPSMLGGINYDETTLIEHLRYIVAKSELPTDPDVLTRLGVKSTPNLPHPHI